MDGDIHTASDHNDKFSLIADTINGNIDLENVSHPNSVMTWRSIAQNLDAGAGLVTDSGGNTKTVVFGYRRVEVDLDETSAISDAATDGTFSTALIDQLPNGVNVILNSHRKADRDYVFLGAAIHVVGESGAGSAHINHTMLFQYASSINGGYVTMATATFKRLPGSSDVSVDGGAASVSARLLRTGRFFRIAVKNDPSVLIGPPSLSVEVFLKPTMAA